MEIKPIRPSIRRLQEDFAARLARQRMLERIRAGRPKRDSKGIDLSNSEPWPRSEDSLAGDWEIAKDIAMDIEKWTRRSTASSVS
ncbi:hypothetical protein [Haloferula sargassicola]|uniref:Uncharacterized protein n=1 Tax=Haloferula sargassicola TaxID=490096 RepID=A0ABP9US46_9BACT